MKIKKPPYKPLDEVPVIPIVMMEKSSKKIELLLTRHFRSKDKNIRFLAMSGTEIYLRGGRCSDVFINKIIKFTASSDGILREGAFEALRTAVTRKRKKPVKMTSATRAFGHINSLLTHLLDALDDKQIKKTFARNNKLDVFLLDAVLFYLLDQATTLAQKIAEHTKSRAVSQNNYYSSEYGHLMTELDRAMNKLGIKKK